MRRDNMPDTVDGKRMEADAMERKAAEILIDAAEMRNAADEQAEAEEQDLAQPEGSIERERVRKWRERYG